MILTKFLTQDRIQHGVFLSSKKRALELVGQLVSEYVEQHTQNEHSCCAIACFSNLFQREKLGSTALNLGVALPHAKLPAETHLAIDKPIAIFLQLAKPIDYEANDNKGVDLIYAVLFPASCCEQYKDVLPQIAQQLADKTRLKQLRQAQSADEIWHILQQSEQQAV